MKKYLRTAAVVAFAVLLSGCAFLSNLENHAVATVAAVGDTFVPPKVHAPIANSAAAAENLYTGATKILTVVIQNHAISVAQATAIVAKEDKVYDAIVALRTGVEQKKDVTALLDTFNSAYGEMFKSASDAGVALPNTGDSP